MAWEGDKKRRNWRARQLVRAKDAFHPNPAKTYDVESQVDCKSPVKIVASDVSYAVAEQIKKRLEPRHLKVRIIPHS